MILSSVKERGLAAFDHSGNTVAPSDGPRAADDAEQLRTRCRMATEAATRTEVHASEMALTMSDRDPCKGSLVAPVVVDGVSARDGEVDEPHPPSFAPGLVNLHQPHPLPTGAGREGLSTTASRSATTGDSGGSESILLRRHLDTALDAASKLSRGGPSETPSGQMPV